MWIKKRHQFVTSFLRIIFRPFLKIKYKAVIEKPISIEDGSLVICNHTTSMDQFFMGCLFKKHLYYMASIDLFQHRFIGKAVEFLVNPIKKEKGKKSDLKAVKDCLRVSKEGGNICIFVEGNRSFSGALGNVDKSIVKLVRLLKKPLVICNIKGGYGTEPRWGNSVRKGKMHVGVKEIIPYEKILDMDNDELYHLIIDGITVNDYDFYSEYNGTNLAESIERILYICPVCHRMHTIYSKGDYIFCKECGLEVKYQGDLRLKANKEEFIFNNVLDWWNFQIDYIRKMDINDGLIYEDEISVYNPILYKKKKYLGDGYIRLYHDHLSFNLIEYGNIDLPIKDIEDMSLLGKKKLNIYANGKTYQVFKDKKLNLLKYIHMFYLLKGGKENEFLGL